MAKYKIAWLPGDGVGNDVMDCAKIVLDTIGLDAEYIHGDVGWEFWKKEGNPLPDRTIDLLKQTDCALFGAITSKPKKEANDELPENLKMLKFQAVDSISNFEAILGCVSNGLKIFGLDGHILGTVGHNYGLDSFLIILYVSS